MAIRTKKPGNARSVRGTKTVVAGDSLPAMCVVGIGASAGGLAACTRLFSSLRAPTGMAFILAQHLDSSHDSLLVELLASHTTMTVLQATDHLRIEPEHLYIIPPGFYLGVGDGCIRLSQPPARIVPRLPVNFLLQSLATAYGPRAIAIILSGTGADGSDGVVAVKQNGGMTIAQDAAEAEHDGMPRSAAQTGAIDLVLPVDRMAAALATHASTGVAAPAPGRSTLPAAGDWLATITDLLRASTAHDFRPYKRGTLQRRIERRMALIPIAADDHGRYIALLENDIGERNLLAKDLLIHVTSFFRDPEMFDSLSDTIVPDLIARHGTDRPMRIWIAGCSSGEEAYSIAMVFREHIAAARLPLKLQIFATDVDPEAVAVARHGAYPASIAECVGPARLQRFFERLDDGYRVLPELRESIVFTVHDLLVDPPFSRLDLVSCRNLLIYLGPEAQAKAVSLFHFALRENGVLLLGNSETIDTEDGRFMVESKSARTYRSVGERRPRDVGFPLQGTATLRPPPRQNAALARPRAAILAELCRRLIIENFAPAAVLINTRRECLYFLGPTDPYLKVAPGLADNDIIAMARDGVRSRLKSAIDQAIETDMRIVIAGGRTTHNNITTDFDIVVEPVRSDGETLLFVCFVGGTAARRQTGSAQAPEDLPRIAELERDLAAARTELQRAVRDLDIALEDQRAISEEALSVNEELQSTNEELVTSKEELQSLNEELTTLNSQLQETLDRQRTTSNDLQNLLYSTDIATIFLDQNFCIRFFTPATSSIFSIIPGDIGRPLADLSSLTADTALLADARSVLQTSAPTEREVASHSGAWFIRKILPYKSRDNDVEGVVITFEDITDRHRIADALEVAERQARRANIAKSRFLAAASHDLRQPLQSLTLLHGLLAKSVTSETSAKLVNRLDETVGVMSAMLNTLLDINQIEAGTIQVELVDFRIGDLLERLRGEFGYLAHARGLSLRVVPSALTIRSDPRLLEQMLRNLLSNALKYTRHGKILIGCRRRGDQVSIDVLDTGIGIPAEELQTIFEEFHQLDNAAREHSRGFGLGLSIVRHLGALLAHDVSVQSRLGRGSTFSIGVGKPIANAVLEDMGRGEAANDLQVAAHRIGTILVVEDDPALCELVEMALREQGHVVAAAANGSAALAILQRQKLHPDLIISDFNLPNHMNGVEFAARSRDLLHRRLPVIILTGDISTDTLREIALQECVQLNKPVRMDDLAAVVQRLLTPPRQIRVGPASTDDGVIYIVEDDAIVSAALRDVLEADGRMVEDFASCEAFLASYDPARKGCLLLDAYLPGMKGLDLLRHLVEIRCRLPVIMITGKSDVAMAVQAMKAGASDFIEKPFNNSDLLERIRHAISHADDTSKVSAARAAAAAQIAILSFRQRQIMERVLAGQPSKNIAADLGISQRTVENHRAAIMKKTGSKSVPALARLALAAGCDCFDPDVCFHSALYPGGAQTDVE